MLKQHFKIVVVGATGVGKTSLINQLITGGSPNKFIAHAAVDFHRIPFRDSLFLISDTPGQARFRLITENSIRHADGIIIVYDLTATDSFEFAKQLTELDIIEDLPKVLIGNKLDLACEHPIPNEVFGFAQNSQMQYFQTSALTGENVEEAFHSLFEECLEQQKASPSPIYLSCPAPPPTMNRSTCG